MQALPPGQLQFDLDAYGTIVLSKWPLGGGQQGALYAVTSTGISLQACVTKHHGLLWQLSAPARRRHAQGAGLGYGKGHRLATAITGGDGKHHAFARRHEDAALRSLDVDGGVGLTVLGA